MTDYSIGITTYQHRFDKWFKPLINQIKTFRPNIEIMVAVNGEKNCLDETYRKSILEFCASHKNILPNVYPEFRALPKLWNNMMINASNHNMLILNDDITITDVNFFNALESLPEEHMQLSKINGSWSHTLIDRRLMVNWGGLTRDCVYCEEDGDMEWRVGKLLGGRVNQVKLPDIINHVDPENCLKDIKVVNGKYSNLMKTLSIASSMMLMHKR